MRKLLEGRTAIITGGSRGIGKATAILFAEEGANVVVTGRNHETLEETVAAVRNAGGTALSVVADSIDPTAPKRVFEQAIGEFGQVDILINNAGWSDMAAIEETEDELFDEMIQINLFGVFRYAREAVRHFLPRGTGAIVNVSSVNAFKPICGVSYCATKGAVDTLTKNVGIRLAGTGIRCNGIRPGATDTYLVEAWDKGELPGGQVMIEASKKYVNWELPVVKPEQQANVALFLASDMSSAMQGQLLTVDNGAFA
ncbi:SDR family NAD(P)-dependent oxidoreductase [Sphingomonas phyllosphaerae]|uniref:SDR family NAD(P)-dependent oxidoreductase n=1 Tax=Sphingomonas phyllosphaerae TaxID=257003 RepID=UPI000419A2C6|nr:SDR family oxidoreductase [Sphingomonas phyllosphaerae]